MKISIEIARLFKDQCIGSYSGHMASIPNNPVLQSIFIAISGDTYKASDEFADTIILIGEALKVENLK